MKSIRTKITCLTVCAIIAAMSIATLLGVLAIRSIGNNNSRQSLLLLCESGEKNLDYYFQNVEQSVETVAAYAESDLEGLPLEELPEHLERVREIFSFITYKTNGILTYYYRLDPAVSQTEKGFWFVNLDGKGFQEHEVTDIALYDTEDTSQLVWFSVPKTTGKSIWLPPYFTDNLNVQVISYNVPIYQDGVFLGVIGIEIDYSTMAGQVDHIKLYQNGYAFINDREGRIVYHPRIDVTAGNAQPSVPDGLLSGGPFFRYTFDGVEKLAVWLPLSNGMRLNVAVPVEEINAGWIQWIYQISAFAVVLLVTFILITMQVSESITKPLRDLTRAAERLNAGDYDFKLDYKGRDEVGILTSAFSRLISHLGTYISDLNNLAYADALTSVRNKGAFEIFTQNLQAQILESESVPEFAVCIMDCNNLKVINDQFGHDKGDLYLKASCDIICGAFIHSPVFRIGGDEFAVVLQNHDFQNRKSLLRFFDETCAQRRAQAEARWEQVDIARGIAVYDPKTDDTVHDVVRRADKRMYENKWMRKQLLAQENRQVR